MPTYALVYESVPDTEIQAKDADAARRTIADYMGVNGIREQAVRGPNGHVWRIFYDGFVEGRSGWRYTDGKTTRPVFPALTPRPGTLWGDNWQGIYELSDGRFLMADNSEEFTDEDFAVVGAIYYSIYDESGEVDGGWYGYDEDAKWSDFKRFVSRGNGPTIGRCIWKGSVDGFYDVVDMLEDGSPAEEVYEVCGVKPRSAPKKGSRGSKTKAPTRRSPKKSKVARR